MDKVYNKIIDASSIDISLIEEMSKLAFLNNKIPKIIHFCFLDYRNITEKHLKYLKTWFDVLDDSYMFVNWTPELIGPVCEIEEYFLENNKFAFYADYIRCARVYQYGGIYLDCDVNVWKPFDELLGFDYVFDCELDAPYMECAAFMSKKNNRFLEIIKNEYEKKKASDYIKDPKSFLAPTFWCDALNNNGVTVYSHIKTLQEYSEKLSKKSKIAFFTLDTSYLSCPCKRSIWTGINQIPTEKTFCSHMFEGTWSY